MNKQEAEEIVRTSVAAALGELGTTTRKSQSDTEEGVEKSDKKSRPFSIAKYLRGAMKGVWHEAELEKSAFATANKALSEGTSTAGGFLVPDEFSNELIDLLRAKAVIRGLSPRVYQLKGDTLNIPRQTTAATAYWIEENAEKTESEQAFGNVKLVLKEVAALVKVSNNLLMDASPAVDTIIKQDLVTQLQLAEDLAFIQGTGGSQPLGIYNDSGVSTTTLGSGNGAAITFDDLMDAMYAIELANGSMSAWVMHPRTKNGLRQLKDGNGNYIYNIGDLTKGLPDSLLGMPVALSTQIPINLGFGSGTNLSYVILGDFSEFGIGQKAGSAVQISASDQAGDSFKFDQTWFRAVLRVDCVIRTPGSFYIVKGTE